MHLEYPMTKNGLFILRKEDFEDIAWQVLANYQPDVLKTPQPVDIEYLAREDLFLDMRYERLSEDGDILGLIAFSDIVYTGIGTDHEPCRIEIPAGTVLLDPSLGNREYAEWKRYIQAHEASHWICHRSYHSEDNRVYTFCKRERCPAVALRTKKLEYPGWGSHRNWTEDDWEEWQADNLAMSILMPRDMFCLVFYNAMRKCGIHSETLCWNTDRAEATAVIDEIRRVFQVSRRMVEFRLMRFGLLNEGRAFSEL